MTLRRLGTFFFAMMVGVQAPPAFAAEDILLERRVITYDDIDYYGGDLRSLRRVSLNRCVAACRADEACLAFTYNSRSDACFLKSEPERSETFRGAISGRMVPIAEGERTAARERSAKYGFINPTDIEEARNFATFLPHKFPLTKIDSTTLRATAIEAQDAGKLDDAEQAAAARVVLDDSFDSWLALTELLQQLNARGKRYDSLFKAAINATVRAETSDEEGQALAFLGEALIERSRGRDGLRALKIAQQLAPSAKTGRQLRDARERFGFKINDHTIEADNDAPRVCVEFSDPLDAGVDYAPYVKIQDADLAITVNERRLCLDGATHGERFAITLREGLPAAEAGEALLKDVTLRLYIRDRAPAVRMSSSAYILPKTKDATIPITTINTEEVALRLSRVTERNLLRSIQDNFFGEKLSGYREDEIADSLGAPLFEGVLEVDRELNAETVTGVPIAELVPELEPGAYVLTARLPDDDSHRWSDAATQWFMVSDTGLATTSARDGLHVFARSLSDAGAAEGAELTLLAANNEILGTASTDEKGYARFAPGLIRGERGNRPRLLIAQRGEGDFAMLDLGKAAFDLSDRGVEGRAPAGPVDVFVTTERGAYRPRETVYTTILARDAEAVSVDDLPLTVRVLRPDGVIYLERVLQDQGAGGRSFSFALGEAAQRGGWSLAVYDDPKKSALARTEFLVEDFVPQRIEVALTAEQDTAEFGETFPVSVKADYLYGAPGGGLMIEGETLLTPTRELEAFPGYQFGLADESNSPTREPLRDEYVTDANGEITVPMPMQDAPQSTQPFTATAIIRVREGSGRPVEQELTVPVEATTSQIGIKPRFEGTVKIDTDASFDIIAVGTDGEQISLEGATWTLSRLRTRYQWYRQRGEWNYEPYTRRIRVASGKLDLESDDAARIDAPVNWGQHELVVRWPGGENIASSVRFQAGWWAPVAGSGTPDILQVALDKEKYALGDTATLRVEARHAGEAVIQVVSDRLIDVQAVSLEKGESEISLTVTEEWGPGAYVVASLIRPMDEAAKRNPSRALGVAYLPVDPGERLLKPRFTGPDESAPRGPLDASLVLEGLPQGETAYVTVAAVDIGVLNITGFDSPEPQDWYFGQRRLGVDIRDIYGQLIDGLSSATGRIRSGGGATPGSAAPPPVEDVLARFSGVVEVDAEGRAEIKFEVPDFNGAVRLMAVAWTKTAIGSVEKDVLVRDPVVLTVSTPRFLAPGDQSRILVELAHVFGPAGEVGVELEAGPELKLFTANEPIGGMLEEGGRLIFEVPIRAESVADPEISLVMTIPGGKRLTKTIRVPVRANEPDILVRTPLSLVAGAEATRIDADAFEEFVSGTAQGTITVGSLAALDAAGMLRGLDLYPYGCTEQTTSRALPLLYYSDVAKQLGLEGAGQDVKSRIANGISRVLARQGSGGSFGLWSAGGGDYWLDAYVTDFLSRARERGHDVPDYAFDGAIQNLLNRVSYTSDIVDEGGGLAYALMVLAREGEASIGDMRYYADQKASEFPTSLSLAQLGAALAMYGEQKRADEMFKLASARVLDETDTRRGWRRDYGSYLRDASGVLSLAVEAGSQAVDRDAIIERISEAAGKRRYTSTQEKVWTLMAAHALSGEAANSNVTVNGKKLTNSVLRIDDISAGREVPLSLANLSERDIPAMLSIRGKPLQSRPAESNGYKIRREYFTLEGEPADLDDVKQNDRLLVELVIENSKRRRGRIMIDDPLPAGFEIDNPNLIRSGQLEWLEGDTSDAEYTAFQSNRFLAAVTGNSRQLRFVYTVRAISPGTFRHPAAQVEDMYRPEFRARTPSGSITIAAK